MPISSYLGERGNLLLKDIPSDVSVNEDINKCACRDCEALALSEHSIPSDSDSGVNLNPLIGGNGEIFEPNCWTSIDQDLGPASSSMSIIGRYEAIEGPDEMTPLIRRMEKALEEERLKPPMYTVTDFILDALILLSGIVFKWYEMLAGNNRKNTQIFPKQTFDVVDMEEGIKHCTDEAPIETECKFTSDESDWEDFNVNKTK